MEWRSCGRSSLRLPILGVGCWSFGGGSYWGEQEQKDVDAVVSRALELGCGFFDTAEGYNEGRSEEALGKALRGRRDRAIVATKISPEHCAPPLVIRHCEASLRRLNTDYLDLYMIHWPLDSLASRPVTRDLGAQVAPPSIHDALGALENLRRAGKIRHIGLSNFGVRQLKEARQSRVEFVCDQLPYSLLFRAIEWEILPFCEREGISILGYMPLMQGLLTGKYRSAEELPPTRARTRHFRSDRPGSRHGEPGAEVETFAAVEAVRTIAEREAIPMERLAVAWSMAHPAVTCTITGARNAVQLEENAGAATMKLAPPLVEELKRATDALKGIMGKHVDLFEGAAKSRTH